MQQKVRNFLKAFKKPPKHLLLSILITLAATLVFISTGYVVNPLVFSKFPALRQVLTGETGSGSNRESAVVVAVVVPTLTPTPIPQPTLPPKPKPVAITPTVASQPITPPPLANVSPTGGYSRVQVNTGNGTFTVDVVTADLGSTRVVVDTASDSDCANSCPVMSVGSYAARSGAYAAINGSYFCPTEYPSCAGKTNSFDTLLMNKNKVYFNSANNVYSVVPAVIFSGSSARFVGQSLEWGRDTGVDAVLANYPLLLSGGQIVYGGSGDPKLTSKGPRGFVATTGSTVYIGVVSGASMSDSANALKALGIQNALNLDEGGSTALWYNGSYMKGPGRNVPNALLFLRK